MEEIFSFILKSFYLMLPAYLANMAPVIVKKINMLNYPLDFNKILNGKPILGKNKTFRGFIFAVLFGIIAAYIQHSLYNYEEFRDISLFNYDQWLLFGFLMGFGAIIGDAIKSFFKRRMDIKPGIPLIPFDQIDFVIGALLSVSIFFRFLSWNIAIASLLLSFVLHILVNHFAFYTKIRNEKW